MAQLGNVFDISQFNFHAVKGRAAANPIVGQCPGCRSCPGPPAGTANLPGAASTSWLLLLGHGHWGEARAGGSWPGRRSPLVLQPLEPSVLSRRKWLQVQILGQPGLRDSGPPLYLRGPP